MTTVMSEAIAVIDFGSQYSQLILRRVREAHVYCELFRYDAPAEEVLALQPRGFILSGGPNSVYEPDAPRLPAFVLESGVPVLGICYGMQLLAHNLGGRVAAAQRREYGPALLQVADLSCPLFTELPFALQVWMSHGDRIESLPTGFSVVAQTDNSPVAAMAHPGRATSYVPRPLRKLLPRHAVKTRSTGAPRSAHSLIISTTIWMLASRCSVTGLEKSLLAASAPTRSPAVSGNRQSPYLLCVKSKPKQVTIKPEIWALYI